MKKIFLIIAIIVIIGLVLVGLYFSRFSTNFRVFRVGGGGVGQYQAGVMVKATADFNHPLSSGDVIIYKQGDVDVMAVIKGQIGPSYRVKRSRNREEIIEKEEIKWLVEGELY
jgi:hypothetical protein